MDKWKVREGSDNCSKLNLFVFAGKSIQNTVISDYQMIYKKSTSVAAHRYGK